METLPLDDDTAAPDRNRMLPPYAVCDPVGCSFKLPPYPPPKPAAIDTLPPTPPLALLRPADSVTAPPVDTCASPTRNEMAPDGVTVAPTTEPVPMVTPPDAPFIVVPLLNTSVPLTPDTMAGLEAMAREDDVPEPLAIVTVPPRTVEPPPPKILIGPPLICPPPATMDTEPPVTWLDVPAFSATDAVVDGYDPVAPATMDTVPAEYVDPVELPVCRLTAPGVARHRQQPHR